MLTIDGLTKVFTGDKHKSHADVRAVDDVTLEIKQGELFTLLGPSGCGKTTMLRCLAGLETPDRGVIQLGDRVLYSNDTRVNVPSNARGLGMVFQSYAIWPHMSVHRNVAFPLEVAPRRERLSRSAIKERVEQVLSVVHLDGLAGRRATDLSGGQQQRLALARALVMQPPLMLLDEPLSNLDAKLRESMRFELKRLQRELGITSVYVTHDQIEALAMSNRIAVMRGGRPEQVGRPREIYTEPASSFVADFIGSSNVLPGEVRGYGPDATYEIEVLAGEIVCRATSQLQRGDKVLVSIRPECIELSREPVDGSDRGVWQGIVETRAFIGEAVDHVVRIGEVTIRARTRPNISIEAGTRVNVHVANEDCIALPAT